MMKLPPYFLFLFFFLSFVSFHVSPVIGLVRFSRMITVNTRGGGDFTTIQAAIDSVPSNNDRWIRIHVRGGIYREKVHIPVDKQFILMQGDGQRLTVVKWGDYADSLHSVLLADSATFTSAANNTVVKGITFENTFKNDGVQTKRALAALISGDKSSFHSCSFIGVQDTLCDLAGRHYFVDCHIQGSIDFIFGFGQSIYERCTLYTVAIPASPGYVTAQGRDSESLQSGFVFKSCNVIGSEKVYLGRAWGPYSRVFFYQTFMSDVVVPQGWDSWRYKGKESQLMYAESGCSGPGSDMSGRVGWEKNVGSEGIKMFTDISFIDSEGWLTQQP